MEITDVRVRMLNNGRLKAAASVTFDNELVVHDIKVIESQDKRFLAMPAKQLPNGVYMDIVHPINREMRQKLEDMVCERYRIALEEESGYGRAEEDFGREMQSDMKNIEEREDSPARMGNEYEVRAIAAAEPMHTGRMAAATAEADVSRAREESIRSEEFGELQTGLRAEVTFGSEAYASGLKPEEAQEVRAMEQAIAEAIPGAMDRKALHEEGYMDRGTSDR